MGKNLSVTTAEKCGCMLFMVPMMKNLSEPEGVAKLLVLAVSGDKGNSPSVSSCKIIIVLIPITFISHPYSTFSGLLIFFCVEIR